MFDLKKIPLYIASLKPIQLQVADHDYFNVFLKSKKDLEQLLPGLLSDLSILIMGCGYRYTDVLLYSNFAKNIYGVDIENAFYRDGFIRLFKKFRSSNKSVFSSLCKAFIKRNGLPKYYKRIQELSGVAIDHKNMKLISYDGKTLQFEDSEFDTVLSNAVLEHVIDLEFFFSEISRVTKPRGISYHLYHNYYSFSGSHLPESICRKNPWGHLRGKYQTSPNHLNKVTIEALLTYFSFWFEIINTFQVSKDHSKNGVNETFSYEEEGLLTPDIRKELKNYSNEQLLTRSYLVIGRKKDKIL